MTHTLHRLGNRENLAGDYVVFAMSAKGINEKDSAPAMRKFLELAYELDPINLGDMKTGNFLKISREEMMDKVQDVSIVHAVYSDEKKVAALLKKVKEADLGVSVVVSGLLDRVKAVGDSVNVPPHTVECSAGIWGKMEKLPSAETLQLTTMCGHGMVAANLVNQYVKQIKFGKMTAAEAAKKLAEPCECGVFNIERAERLLTAMAAEDFQPTRIQAGQTSL